ncbi:glutamine amidotransferase [Marinobacterium arenosum]|uniref:glutamine amidotransferase n=1 Tax=Marinobacterium arenosum TaxID=2862496 RepID=UPI001C93BBBC|nr:glutamine amidotransferase [Marinobacterium arenosum]MBY4677487.1 glutamine amidotransferase [Marinobacterium arenosum]
MRLLLLKTGASFDQVIAEQGDFEQLFAAGLVGSDVELVVWDARSDQPLPVLDDIQGVLITGSHAMVTDREPWSERLQPWLRQLAEQRMPLLGVCYGHQLLAQALGGEAGNHPRGPEVGTVEIRLTEAGRQDPLFAGLPERFPVHVTHTQSALQLPPGAEVLARNDYEPYQAFRLGDSVWGVQFHPEFNAAVTRVYLAQQAERLAELGQDPDGLQAQVTETAHSGSLLGRFAELCRQRAHAL